MVSNILSVIVLSALVNWLTGSAVLRRRRSGWMRMSSSGMGASGNYFYRKMNFWYENG